MKILSALLGLFLLMTALSFQADAAVLESASVKLRRLRDNRVIAARNGNGSASQYSYPNDRVARGEAYQVEISYYSDGMLLGQPFGGFHAYTFKNILNVSDMNTSIAWIADRDGTQFAAHINYSWQDTVPFSPSFSNVYFYVLGSHTGNRLTYIKLPIGSY